MEHIYDSKHNNILLYKIIKEKNKQSANSGLTVRIKQK